MVTVDPTMHTSDQAQYIADWLSRQNHCENKDEFIGLKIDSINTNISACMSIQEIQDVMQDD